MPLMAITVGWTPERGECRSLLQFFLMATEVGTEKVSTHSGQCPEELLTARWRVKRVCQVPWHTQGLPETRPMKTSWNRLPMLPSRRFLHRLAKLYSATRTDCQWQTHIDVNVSHHELPIFQRLSNTGIFRGNRAQGGVIRVLRLTADVQQMLVPEGRTRPCSRSWGRSTKHTHNVPALPELLFQERQNKDFTYFKASSLKWSEIKQRKATEGNEQQWRYSFQQCRRRSCHGEGDIWERLGSSGGSKPSRWELADHGPESGRGAVKCHAPDQGKEPRESLWGRRFSVWDEAWRNDYK